MKRFNFQAFFKNMRHHSVSEMGEKDTAAAVASSASSASSVSSASQASQPAHEMEVEYRAEEEALDGFQTTSQANSYTPSQSLREDYFLAVQCERLTCRHSVQEANYKFCPKCGYTTVQVYDYYQLFGLAVSREGLFDEELLKKNFRELSKHYHPDSQTPSLQSPEPSLEQFNDSEQVSESPYLNEVNETQGTTLHHENFSFLSAALEILKNPTTRGSYHQQYIETLQELFPEQMALAEEAPEAAPSVSPTPSEPTFSFQALWKRCVLLSVTFLDLLVTALIGFLVIKAYLWGAVLSLIGAWFYFRKTRQFLSRLYS